MSQYHFQNTINCSSTPTFVEKKKLILSCLDENKAEDVVSIDLRNKSDIADYMIIATGLSKLHISSLVNKMIYQAKQALNLTVEVEGALQCRWVFIGFNEVMLHIFDKEARDYYQLEKMWLL